MKTYRDAWHFTWVVITQIKKIKFVNFHQIVEFLFSFEDVRSFLQVGFLLRQYLVNEKTKTKTSKHDITEMPESKPNCPPISASRFSHSYNTFSSHTSTFIELKNMLIFIRFLLISDFPYLFLLTKLGNLSDVKSAK